VCWISGLVLNCVVLLCLTYLAMVYFASFSLFCLFFYCCCLWWRIKLCVCYDNILSASATPWCGRQMQGGMKKSQFSINISLHLGNDTQNRASYYKMWTGNCIKAFEWYYFQWHCVISNPYFRVTSLFDAEYLRNGTRHKHSYNETHGLIKVPCRTTLTELEWLSEIFNNTKHRAVSLTLNFLF